MSNDLTQTPNSTTLVNAQPKHSRFFWIALELIAVAAWVYTVCKLFIFDIDIYLFELIAPDYLWVLNYRFLFVLIAAALCVWIFGLGLGLLLFGLLLAYPLFLVLWRVPSAIFRRRSWTLAFAALNFTTGFFRSFRRNVTIAALTSSLFVVALVSTTPILLEIAVAGLLVIVAYLYYLAFVSALAPMKTYDVYKKILPPIRVHFIKNHKLDDAIRDTPSTELSAEQQKVWIEAIQIPILANRLYLFLARRFKDYQQSSIPFVHSVFIIAALFVFTIVAFSAINFAAYKSDPQLFETTKTNFFSFVWYSFNTFVFNFIKEILPQTALAQALWMSEAFCALFLVAIVVAMYFSIRSQKVVSQVDAIIETLEGESREFESFVQREYRIVSIDDAIAELDRLKGGLIQVVMWLTRNMR